MGEQILKNQKQKDRSEVVLIVWVKDRERVRESFRERVRV
jgi:hypothetical protein